MLQNVPSRNGDDTSLLPIPSNVQIVTDFDTTVIGSGDTWMRPNFLPKKEANEAFLALKKEIPYQQWYHMPSMDNPSALKPLSRTKCALALVQPNNTIPLYRFPVNAQDRYPVVPIDEKTPALLQLIQKVQKETGVLYNHVVVLYYKDGNDAIGFHSDKTVDLEDNSSIVTLSLGQERPYVLRKDNIFVPTATQQFILKNGSLLSLGPKTNAEWFHSVIMLKNVEKVEARISVTFRKVATFKNLVTNEITGKGAAYQSLNWPTELRGKHRLDNYLEAPPDAAELLQFWFGPGPEMLYNGSQWWRGMMADAKGANEEERRFFTDGFILQKWGPLFDSLETLSKWTKTPLGTVAAIVLLDQCSRQAFRGTKRAFEFDSMACQLANDLLDHHSTMFLDTTTTTETNTDNVLPWTMQIFVYFALLHSENVVHCERGAQGLANLQEILKNPKYKGKSARMASLLKSAKDHLHTISKFGRYPHRSLILGRTSTPEEVFFLEKNANKAWMNSQIDLCTKSFSTNPKKNNVKKKKDGFRVLVLHSNRQSSVIFQKRTREAFAKMVGEGSTLVYATAPHKYVAQGEALTNTKHLMASKSPNTRCWWNASDDPETMIYTGMEESIAFVDNLAKNNGPFDGIIGFSQGGTLAGLLAALVSDKSPLVQNLSQTLQFCVIISGFFVRDVRPEFRFCNGPLRDPSGPIQIPSFHVYGKHDFLVLPERSIALANSFAENVGGIPKRMETHPLDHFAKAIGVWPVEEIGKWIHDHFIPIAQHSTRCSNQQTLAEKLHAVRDHHFRFNEEKKENNAMDEKLALVMEHLHTFENDIVLRNHESEEIRSVNIVLLDNIPISSKSRNIKVTTDALVELGKEFFAENWIETIDVMVSIFPSVLSSLYAADKEIGTFRKGIVQCLVKSIRSCLDRKKMDFISCQLPNKRNKQFITNGLIREMVEHFPQFHVFHKKDSSLHIVASYEKLLSALAILHEDKDPAGIAKVALKKQKGSRNANELEKLLGSPLSEEILNPVAEPVDIAKTEEMLHLHSFLRDEQASQIKELEKVFMKGTLCRDGRLDLCKQVIGPNGVEDLELSLQKDGSCATPKVRHLLLGNNVAGSKLAASVAKLIENKSTKITTWYIAGNELDAKSVSLVTRALENDQFVAQLWLKRNPLKPESGIFLNQMLQKNCFLKVLDLTNTGLLDEGCKMVCQGILQNKDSALKVLYLEANGITLESIPIVCEMISQSKIKDLCIGCNRIGDKGAILMSKVLNFLEHIDLSSCGIGHVGAEAIASTLPTNFSLKKLDLGFLKSTNVLQEVPNAIGNQGAKCLAEALLTNTTLLSLNLLHNGIFQEGVANLAKALNHGNQTLLFLNIEQLGIPHNELTRETIRTALKRNMDNLSAEDKLKAMASIHFEHLNEIKSVYRNEQ